MFHRTMCFNIEMFTELRSVETIQEELLPVNVKISSCFLYRLQKLEVVTLYRSV